MSLLLKALEKSEDEKQPGEGAAESPGASAAPSGTESGGGFKLSGGGAGPGSKLGSALGGADASPQAARKVVAAHAVEPAPHEAEAEAEAEALVVASRKSRIKNFVTIVVLVVVAGAGWYAWQEFGSQLLPGSAVEGIASQSDQGEQPPAATVDDATLLPLNEPIYDIQESINLTSTGSSSSGSSSANEQDIQEQVAQVVTNIIESQLDKQREFIQQQQRIVTLDSDEQASIEEEISNILAEPFDVTSAQQEGAFDNMVAKLEALSQPYVAKGGREFVKPAGSELPGANGEVALVEETGDDSQAAPAPVEETKQVLVLAKSGTNLKDVFDDAVASFKAGDLNHAERAFRTVLAAEPKNASALVGLAKVHHSRGNVRIAAATLLKAAEILPDDPIVISELISVQSGSADPLVSESRIQSLLGKANNPDVQARLRFLLGNAFAKQQRWLPAKEAFILAHGLDQSNPDIAFNLAVIFDYLNEPENAIRMYNTALSSAAATPSSFDLQVARDRIEELSGN